MLSVTLLLNIVTKILFVTSSEGVKYVIPESLPAKAVFSWYTPYYIYVYDIKSIIITLLYSKPANFVSENDSATSFLRGNQGKQAEP